MSARYIVMLGPQGSGKGTQAEKLAEYFNLSHVSTGAVFRRHLKEKTTLGRKAKLFLDSGHLVSDSITNAMVSDIIESPLYKSGIVFDGYPRTLPQAGYLDGLLPAYNVIYLDITDNEVVKRLSGRRVCPNEHIYHTLFNSPKHKGVCDSDTLPLIQREDDTPDFIKKRLTDYHTKTKKLLAYYKKRENIRHIDASQSIEKVFQDIIRSL